MDISRRLRVARILVLLELVLAATSVIEASIFVGVGLALPGSALLALGHVVLLALAARSLGRGGPTRLARWLQLLVLGSAVIDLAVAALLGMDPLPVVIAVRVVVPVVVLLLVRRDRALPPAQLVATHTAVSA